MGRNYVTLLLPLIMALQFTVQQIFTSVYVHSSLENEVIPVLAEGFLGRDIIV